MKRILFIVMILAGIAAARTFLVAPALLMAVETTKMCRGKIYQAIIDKIATAGSLKVVLTAQPILMPAGATFNEDPNRYIIEYMPDANVTTATFEFLITFDPNMCIEPQTRIWERTYQILEPIPAPEIPIRPFAEVSG